MTLTLSLTPEMEQYLVQKASEQGLSTEDYTVQLLTTAIPTSANNTKLANLLQSWIDQGDAEEQQETGDYLIQALDADRLSDRPLYPAKSAIVMIVDEEPQVIGPHPGSITSEATRLSEQSLAKDGNRPEEDAAWSYLQSVQ
jgi:hypothetical protein